MNEKEKLESGMNEVICNGCETGMSGVRHSDEAAIPDHSSTSNEEGSFFL